MALIDKINEDLKTAMKNKNQAALRAIRGIKSGILLLQTEEGRKEVTEQDEIKLIQKMVKQRKESIEIFEKQNRNDLSLLEKEELDVISIYLPQQLSEEDLRKEIAAVIAEVGARSSADLGKVMPVVMNKLAGKSDGKTISSIVKELLQNQ
jgi:uncharacterized protein